MFSPKNSPKNTQENYNFLDYYKSDKMLTTSLKKPIFFQNLKISTLNHIKNPDQNKQIDFHRFFIKDKVFNKNSRSLSPENKIIPKTPILVNKFKDIKKNSQECEIKLQHLHGLLKEEINTYKLDENSSVINRISLCMQMINTVYVCNDEMSELFKEIVPILEELLYCSDELKKKIKLILNERNEKDNFIKEPCTYISLIQTIIKKIIILRENHLNELNEKEQYIAELTLKFDEKNKENVALKETIQDLEEKRQLKIENDIFQQNEKISLMESELNRVQAENSHLRVIYQKKSEDYYLMEQQIKNEISEELNKTHQEKENSMKIQEKHDKEFENLKIMYGKLLVNHRVLCSSTKGLIEKAERYEAQISELINENQTLKIRAGVAWEEMTPRPSLEKFQKVLNLEPEFFVKKTTKFIIDELFVKIKEKLQNDKTNKTEKIKEKFIKSFKSFKNLDTITVLPPENLSQISTKPNKFLGKKTSFGATNENNHNIIINNDYLSKSKSPRSKKSSRNGIFLKPIINIDSEVVLPKNNYSKYLNLPFERKNELFPNIKKETDNRTVFERKTERAQSIEPKKSELDFII